jgi:hypothetical protein
MAEGDYPVALHGLAGVVGGFLGLSALAPSLGGIAARRPPF